jgi:CRISPR/Cas system-associated exonuclease Cas4 (RecB family)
MTFPKDFVFTQSNLQDYVDCQRRFQLRYLLHQAWPAVEAEPFLEFERMMDQGSRFHNIVHQHLTDLPVSQIEQSLGNDEIMKMWWVNYQHSLIDGPLETIFLPGARRYVELSLSIPICDHRMVAKYDLLVVQSDGKLLIIDWKTSKIRPKRKWLSDRLQTHIYLYILSQANSSITNGRATDPSFIEMIYWFTNYPEQPERFNYHDLEYISESEYLENLITAVSQKSEAVFPLTPDIKLCQFCTYRSLCNRGIKPGELPEVEEMPEPDRSSDDVSLDYEQIGEIEY